MKKPWNHIVILIAILLLLLPIAGLGWIAFGYLKYGTATHQACQGYEWWEDEAECAAEFALSKNDPRYCRINLFGEIGDVCASIFADSTTDPATCKMIDHLPSRDQCEQRFARL